jgi:putative DNA primase/helicase
MLKINTLRDSTPLTDPEYWAERGWEFTARVQAQERKVSERLQQAVNFMRRRGLEVVVNDLDDRAVTRCPRKVHDQLERRPFLDVMIDEDGGLILYCRRGCAPGDVKEALESMKVTDEEPLGDSEHSETDDGNALRLIDAHGHEFRRVSDMKRWYHWDGCRWAYDHEDRALREAARELARRLPVFKKEQRTFRRNAMSSVGLSAAARIAQTDPRIVIMASDLDAHPMLINTPTGVVDLRTGKPRPHDPELLLTRVTAYPVDMNRAHPYWDKFLRMTFGRNTELIGYMQRLAGLALLGHVRDHVLPFSYGTGANGKGVIALVLQGLFGDADQGGYAVSAPDGFLMIGRDGAHPTEIARLRGARLVVCSEQSSGKKFDESKVKRLTGGDRLTGRFMRGDFFDFDPSHLTWVLSNHLPEVREGGPAFWRRVRLIPFRHVVPEHKQVKDLPERLLAAEGPAILGWAVRGAVEVLKNGLQDPEEVVKETKEYEVSEDTLASFIRDECELDARRWCTVSEFRSRYDRHCEQMGVDPKDRLSAKALTRRLTTEYQVKSDRVGSPQVRGYWGIAIRRED